MYPYERSLVEKYKDKPFVLLGVNSDPFENFRKAVTREKLNWRSWSDGPGGPIARQWQIRAWPSVFILDKNGKIRHKNVHGNLESLIDPLLAE